MSTRSRFSRKDMKKAARTTVKRHYFWLFALLLAAAFIGTNYRGMLNLIDFDSNSRIGIKTTNVVSEILRGDFEGAIIAAEQNKEDIKAGESTKIGGLEIGHADGVFSDLATMYSSGSFIASVASSIMHITGSTTVTTAICMFLALVFLAFKSVFITETFTLIYTRIILQARIYDRINPASLLFLFRTKYWVKVSLAFLRYNFQLFLWYFTIIGGIIKHYSYSMVRYILAENPTITGKQAIALSRAMMKGHKWEMFKIDLSFIGWYILGFLTSGLTDMFFGAAYREAMYAEYYAYLRNLAKMEGLPGVELLNDSYLFKRASEEEIDKAYWEVLDIMTRPDMDLKQPSKIRRFFQDVFGVVLWYDKQELEYRRDMTEKATVASYQSVLEGKSYPTRLCPTRTAESRVHLEHTLYMRHYSVMSLILIFFSFCLVGWLWEVSIHLVEDGVFVNRGVMHGPWLPIYGTGAVLILLVLNKLRQNPLIEFLAAISLCGAVEYFGSWMLEIAHDGTKWWDYTGYFLNINGRICAEGLLVFGIAGVTAVYFLAPLLDNSFSKIKESLKLHICIVLMALFISDMIYSHFIPNTGVGITDYGDTYTEVSIKEETNTAI